MYPHFIELHCEKTGDKVFINIENITVVTPLDERFDYRRIYTNDHDYTDVKESYDDIKRLISDAGALIQKADPRLENLPVSWDTLTSVDRIGEPVFNSNTRRWMLVIDSANDRTWVELINHAGGHEKWIEHDLLKYPLNRMVRK